jgi:hypothetical protein
MEADMASDSIDHTAQDEALTPSQRQTLEQAEHLLSNGQPGEAARLFAKLAEGLVFSNRSRRAANLHAQAAQAFADSHNETAALTQARAALTLFRQNRMVERMPIFYANIRRKLTGLGMQNAAETLANEFASKLPKPTPAPQATPAMPPAVQSARLPTNCPKCGAPIRSSEAHWIDANMAECGYCGTLIRPAA